MIDELVTDMSDPMFWTQSLDNRHRAYRQLREAGPVHWVRQPPTTVFPDPDPDDGYWAVMTHAEIREVSKNAELYCSSQGVHLDDLPPEINEIAGSFLVMDNPRHAQIRGLVQQAFSLRAVKEIGAQIEKDADRVVDELSENSTGDFVSGVARKLPLLTMMRMLGVAEDGWPPLIAAVDDMILGNDPDHVGERDGLEMVFDAVVTLAGCAVGLAEERRSNPADDLITKLVQAELDGAQLTDEEIGAFFVLLASAGTDTTRQTTSHALYELSRNPDQRALLLEDFDVRIGPAIEEVVRFASPVNSFRRTATADSELGGQMIAAGDKVVLFYGSGNRDDLVFEDPDRFDITRYTNPHLGFGGGGPHYCMGAAIAKVQLRAILGRLLRAFPDLEVNDPAFLTSHFMNGINSMEMHTGRRASA